MDILLTNDDGIDSPGLHALCDRLAEIGTVTVVAPATDQSAVGRAMSGEVAVHEHALGYAIEGTPADCVVAGIEALCPRPDVVVAGVNRGANIGMYTLGRSGTVSAAVEAAYFGVPAIAASLYLPVGEYEGGTVDGETYGEAVEATGYLVENAIEAGVFEQADYLNLNAPPLEEGPAPMEITRPSRAYDMTADHDDGIVTLTDRMWERMERGDLPDPQGTDRRALVDGRVSVSPLTAPHTTEHHEALDGLATAYD